MRWLHRYLLWRRRNHCIVCGTQDAKWLWLHEDIGEVRMCDWHNAIAQAERMGSPIGRVN